ncbi:hypothetical protein [Slackia sp.]
MLTFAKKTDDGTTATYEYLPHGASRTGLVSINRATNEASVIEKSPDDDGMCTGQMLAYVRRMNRAGKLEQSGTLSWY